jgi:hypothetical protein
VYQSHGGRIVVSVKKDNDAYNGKYQSRYGDDHQIKRQAAFNIHLHFPTYTEFPILLLIILLTRVLFVTAVL